MRGDYRSTKRQKRSGVDDGRGGSGQTDYRSHTHGQNELGHEHHGTDNGNVSAQSSDLFVRFLTVYVFRKLKKKKKRKKFT